MGRPTGSSKSEDLPKASRYHTPSGKRSVARAKTMKKIGVCLWLLVGSIWCVAQTRDSVVYPEVTVQAHRIAEAIGSSVSEADTTVFELMKDRGLSQVLETQGLIAIRSYAPGGVANFSVRGSGSQHTQVVWDGIPVNDPMLGQTDLSTISLGGVSSVRMLYGSSGLTNNSGGIGGTIELSSLQPRAKNGIDIRLNLRAGSFGLYGVSLRVRDKHKRLFGATSVEYQTAQNNFRYTNIASLDREDKQMENAAVQRVGASRMVGVYLNDKNQLRINLYFAQANRQLSPTMLTTPTNERLLDRDIWGALRWERFGKRSSISVTASYLYGKQEYTDINDYTYNHLYQANKNLIRYKLNLGKNLHLNVGADIFFENAKSDSAYRYEPHRRYWQAAFASLKYVPKKWIAAQILIREDIIDGKFSPVQGLFGVEVKPTKWFTIKGNVSRNFRAATINDLYWVPGGNPDLKSETGFSWETGLLLKHKLKRWNFKFDATYFQSEIDNWIIWLPNAGVWTPQNKRAVSTMGVETQLETSVSIGKVLLNLNASYTMVSAKVSKGADQSDASLGKQLIYVPEHLAKTQFSVNVARLFLLYGHQFMGERYTTADNQSALDAFNLSFVSMGYEHKLKKHLIGINLTIDNLFNTEYQTVAWRPMPGRSFLINLNYKFQ